MKIRHKSKRINREARSLLKILKKTRSQDVFWEWYETKIYSSAMRKVMKIEAKLNKGMKIDSTLGQKSKHSIHLFAGMVYDWEAMRYKVKLEDLIKKEYSTNDEMNITEIEIDGTIDMEDLSDIGERFAKIGMFMSKFFPEVEIWREHFLSKTLVAIHNDKTGNRLCILLIQQRDFNITILNNDNEELRKEE